jgi:predicted TIM-barrel fold metal-dependent hydrolase
VFTPGQAGWMEEVDKSIAEYKPDSWKGYTIGDPLSPSSKGTAWRLDDEKLVYPFYEKARKSGLNKIICIHKGLLPRDYEQSWPGVWQHANVDDLPKAAKDNPDFAFIMYHGALRPFLEDPAYELDLFEKTGEIRWVTDLARIPQEHGVKNVYGELGTTFATCAVANPRFAAAVVGSLVNGLGADKVVWGSDSVWYGSPQWQIEAMRRLEIPDDMMKKHGWKTKLGDADSKVKRMIFGENSARLYNYKRTAETDEQLGSDKLAQMKQEYQREGIERNNRFYGYIGKKTTTA